MKRFSGKTAVVTGATSGIGESTAMALLEQGAVVIGMGRNLEKGAQLAAHANAFFYACDFCDVVQVESVCQAILEEHPEIDILINCAGISTEGTVESLSLMDWEKSFHVNVASIFLMSKYILPSMRKKGWGRIVNIASTAGQVGAPSLQLYAATKGAVVQLSKSMAAAYAREGILVNCVCPGGTRTPMMLNMEQQDADAFAELFPLGRLAEPREIADVILFVASEEASFMVGSTILADGGFTCI